MKIGLAPCSAQVNTRVRTEMGLVVENTEVCDPDDDIPLAELKR